jgi:hypothetical protein
VCLSPFEGVRLHAHGGFPPRNPANGGAVLSHGAQSAAGLLDLAEEARSSRLSQRNQFREDGLPPAIERRYLFAAGEQSLLYNVERTFEVSLRVLLGKTPIQRSCCHALSPESAHAQYAARFAAKLCVFHRLTAISMCSISVQSIGATRGPVCPPTTACCPRSGVLTATCRAYNPGIANAAGGQQAGRAAAAR